MSKYTDRKEKIVSDLSTERIEFDLKNISEADVYSVSADFRLRISDSRPGRVLFTSYSSVYHPQGDSDILESHAHFLTGDMEPSGTNLRRQRLRLCFYALVQLRPSP